MMKIIQESQKLHVGRRGEIAEWWPFLVNGRCFVVPKERYWLWAEAWTAVNGNKKNAKYLGIDGGRSVTGGSRSSLLTAIIFSEKWKTRTLEESEDERKC